MHINFVSHTHCIFTTIQCIIVIYLIFLLSCLDFSLIQSILIECESMVSISKWIIVSLLLTHGFFEHYKIRNGIVIWLAFLAELRQKRIELKSSKFGKCSKRSSHWICTSPLTLASTISDSIYHFQPNRWEMYPVWKRLFVARSVGQSRRMNVPA